MRLNKTVCVRLAAVISLVAIAVLAILAYRLSSPPDRVQLAVPSAEAARISFLALGDQGTGFLKQRKVARSMEKVAERMGDLDFVILLGDNFYNNGVQSVHDRLWNWKFENMYAGRALATLPFYSVLGNHDVRGNEEVQIQYSREHAGSGRWQMPGHNYSRDFGTDHGHPLLRVVFLDSNHLTPENVAKLVRSVEDAFAPSTTPATWRVVVAHHPIRNAGHHGETAELLPTLLPVLKKCHVDLYLAAHDHDQQFIVRDGEPYYVISGGGGQDLYDLSGRENGLLFGKSQYGFSGIAVDPSRMEMVFYDQDGKSAARYVVDRNCSQPASVCLQDAPSGSKHKN
ncbi:MAG: metallophosphoesterase [Candidatus Accumulibacter sp.]|nr:metallophosphoesterase [Accumulibacter sp.]